MANSTEQVVDVDEPSISTLHSDEVRMAKKMQKADTWTKKLFRFFFSFLGLFLLLAAYTVFGGYIFMNMERPLEEEAKLSMETKALFINESLDFIADHMVYVMYDEHASFNNCTHSFYDDDPCRVDYPGLYFEHCFQQRQEQCCNGDRCLRKSDSPFCECVRAYRDRFESEVTHYLHQLARLVSSAALDDNLHLDEATGQPYWETQWTFTNSILFVMTSLTLVGYGHISPSTTEHQLLFIVYSLAGLPLMMLFLANIGRTMANFIIYCYSRFGCRWCRVRRRVAEQRAGRVSDDPVPNEPYMATEHVLVPITLTLVIMTTYMMAGAVAFVALEEDWDVMTGFYFTFITLTTIGFGDFVPKQSGAHSHKEDNATIFKLAFTSLYSLCGLALISMGINLMLDQVRSKAKWAKLNLGLDEMTNVRNNKYTLTRSHLDLIMETPEDKRGALNATTDDVRKTNPLDIGDSDSDIDSDDTDLITTDDEQ